MIRLRDDLDLEGQVFGHRSQPGYEAWRAALLATYELEFNDETKAPDGRFQAAMMLDGSFGRPHQFLHIFYSGFQQGDDAFWAKHLYQQWNCFDRIPHEEFAEVIAMLSFDDDDYSTSFLPHMSDEDRAFFDALPDKLALVARAPHASLPVRPRPAASSMAPARARSRTSS